MKYTTKNKHSHNNVKVDIYFTFIGLFGIPTEQELLKTVAELKTAKNLWENSHKRKGVTLYHEVTPSFLKYCLMNSGQETPAFFVIQNLTV